MKQLTAILYFLTLTLPGYAQTKDTFEVYFSVNNATLPKPMQAYIDKLIFNDTLIHGDKLILLGYTDYTGSNGHNDSLSKRRAISVQQYLVQNGFGRDDIKLCTGKGKIDRKNIAGNDGFAPDRKVLIIIDRQQPAKPAVVKMPPKPVPAPPQQIDITKLRVNQAFVLDNILFQGGFDTFRPEAVEPLKTLFCFLEDNPTVRIRIEGHICCGSLLKPGEYDVGTLSLDRAFAVFKYLVDRGISKDRMEYTGLGIRKPLIKPELTEDDMRRNRRVEIRILSK